MIFLKNLSFASLIHLLVCFAGDEDVFNFGSNWLEFLRTASAYPTESVYSLGSRVLYSQRSLLDNFQLQSFKDLSFLDIGCGSGLHSLAAYSLGPSKLLSIDAQLGSVNATAALHKRVIADARWRVRQEDILKFDDWDDDEQFDIVYAWGSLHHTGNTFKGLESSLRRMKPDGRLYVALYAHEELADHDDWLALKKQYLESPPVDRKAIAYSYTHMGLMDEINQQMRSLQKETEVAQQDAGTEAAPLSDYQRFQVILRTVSLRSANTLVARGMDMFVDTEDWVGGYPTEFVKASSLCTFLAQAGVFPLTLDIQTGMLTVLVSKDRSQLGSRYALMTTFNKTSDGCWLGEIPDSWSHQHPSPLRMYEGDACLGAPFGRSHIDVKNFCTQPGRYQHDRGQLLFTTSDMSNPNSNGRVYSVKVPDGWGSDT